MIQIINFILGFILGIIGVNILSSFGDLITTALDALRARLNVYIAKCGADIKEVGKTNESSNAIGFAIPQEIEYYEEEEDD